MGRSLLASLRLVREGWRREELLLLLKSGFLALPATVAFQIDLIAREHALRDGKSAWLERWPDEASGDVLHQALQPLLRFDEAYRHAGSDAAALLTAAETLLAEFRATALPETPPLPEVDAPAAAHYLALDAAFTHTARVFPICTISMPCSAAITARKPLK